MPLLIPKNNDLCFVLSAQSHLVKNGNTGEFVMAAELWCHAEESWGGRFGAPVVQSWLGAQALPWLVWVGAPDPSAKDRGRCCPVLEQVPAEELCSCYVRNLVPVWLLTAVIKCVTEIKMAWVCIHLFCVQKHWWSPEEFQQCVLPLLKDGKALVKIDMLPLLGYH